jgi:heme-degrading monooxygenase HmoA
MFIRATHLHTPPDKVDQTIENFQKQVIPSARSTPGFFGAVLLADRKTGTGIGITYWETAKALSASEEVGIRTRTRAANNVPGTQIVNVERYEMVILDRSQPPKPGEFVQVNTFNGNPDDIDAAAAFVRNNVMPVLKSLKGYRAIAMGVDRQTGRSTLSTMWDTLVDLEASDRNVSDLRNKTAQTAGADDVQVEIFEAAIFDFTLAAAAPSGS